MTFNDDSSSFSKDANRRGSGTSNDALDAYVATATRPTPSENLDPLQVTGADEFRTPDDPTLHRIPGDFNSAYTNTDYPAQPDFGRDAFYQSQPFIHENRASATSYDVNNPYTLRSYNENQAYTSSSSNEHQAYNRSSYNENQAYAPIYNVNQAHNSVSDVNQPSSSVASLPHQFDFTPSANFIFFPSWGADAAPRPRFNFPPYFPQAGGSSVPEWSLPWSQSASPTRATPDLPQLPSGSNDLAPSTHTPSASPEAEDAPYEPLAHSSLGCARRSRQAKAAQGPYASARSYTKYDRKKIFTAPPSGEKLVHDCPAGYSKCGLPKVSGVNPLSKICPDVNYCYMSDSHGCCVAGCPEAQTPYTREEFKLHLNTHPEVETARYSPNHVCPIGDCGIEYNDAHALMKHIENAHCNMHVLCAFCLTRNSRVENMGRHIKKCKVLYPPA